MENVKERGHLDYVAAQERIVLKRILKQIDGAGWSGLIWLRTRQVAGACDRSNDFQLL